MDIFDESKLRSAYPFPASNPIAPSIFPTARDMGYGKGGMGDKGNNQRERQF